jgi:hypothetical protein
LWPARWWQSEGGVRRSRTERQATTLSTIRAHPISEVTYL